MIPLAFIDLSLAEGPHWLIQADGKRTARSWDEAAAFLRAWKQQLDPQPGGGYYKTDFRVEWADGRVYAGRFDIDHDTPCDLAAQVRRTCLFVIGKGKPRHWSEEQYRTFLNRTPNITSSARTLLSLLEGYQIGDAI